MRSSTARRNLRRILLSLAVSLVAIVGLGAAPAQAAYDRYPYSSCWAVGGDPQEYCVGWTGGYPSGNVRAETVEGYYYSIQLQVCGGCSGPTGWSWLTAASATNWSGYTPSVRAGKSSWYKMCAQRFQGGPWACAPNASAVYLGD
jgi:hypothetical protein